MIRNERYIDLHLHTKFSDGERTLDETIADAKNAGLSAIAITDHNTIPSLIHADHLEVIPGAEFSTTYQYATEKKAEVHVVGLFFDGVDSSINSIFQSINKNAYIEAMLMKLNSLGIPVTMNELKMRHPSAKQFGRRMVAELVVEKGYALDQNEVMDRWIGNRSPFYINPLDYMNYMSLEECVQKICIYGGLPILAHPFHYKMTKSEIEELAERFRSITSHPLGIEVYYSKYEKEEIQYLEQLADQWNFLRSAASDRHRSCEPFIHGSYELLEKMKTAMK